METTVVLAIILTLAGQSKPTSLQLPMPDIKTCLSEVERFLTLEQAKDKPHVLYRAAGCEVNTPETPGMDTHEMAPPQ